jgi:UDP:flavonoid glycosyltransferase YjiC (YdhE family)
MYINYRSGVPQVVLPVWYDTYDFAVHAEYLGIGVWASKTSAPHPNAEEFSAGLLTVLADNQKGSAIRAKAKLLGEVSRKAGGRKKACTRILELLRSKEENPDRRPDPGTRSSR